MNHHSEVTSPRIRTTVHCIAGLVVNLGALLPLLSPLDWRTFSGLASLTPVLGFLHILTIPESPHWLVSQVIAEKTCDKSVTQVMKHRTRGALKSLIKLRGLDYDCARERDALGRIKSLLSVWIYCHSSQKRPTHSLVKTKLVVARLSQD